MEEGATFVLDGSTSGPMSTWRAGRLGFEGLAFAPYFQIIGWMDG